MLVVSLNFRSWTEAREARNISKSGRQQIETLHVQRKRVFSLNERKYSESRKKKDLISNLSSIAASNLAMFLNCPEFVIDETMLGLSFSSNISVRGRQDIRDRRYEDLDSTSLPLPSAGLHNPVILVR